MLALNAVSILNQQLPSSLLNTKKSQEFDVVIVGAGILGSAMATALGKQGKKVCLVERDWNEPDRIVGELLQPGGINALRELGLMDALKGMDGIDVHGYAVFTKDENVLLTYPEKEKGIAFHHGRFVMNLRSFALYQENVSCLEATVNDLKWKKDRIVGVDISYKNGEKGVQITAPLTIIADGCFSKFRKHFIQKIPVAKSSFVGLILKNVVLPFPNYGTVILADPSPVLLYQISTSDTRILIDVPGTLPNPLNLKKYLKTSIGPQLPETIQPYFYEALETDRIRSMPNSWLPPSLNTVQGGMILGDAMNIRHPLTGGGMTVALWDVVHYSRTLSTFKNFRDVNTISKLNKRFFWTRKATCSVINILANGLYSLFSAGQGSFHRLILDVNLLWLQKACFGYFKLGGVCASTPIGFLGGLIHEPLSLIGHFFAVAFYGAWIILTTTRFPFSLWRVITVLYTATCVIVPLILAEFMG